jgi:hypothetical protein
LNYESNTGQSVFKESSRQNKCFFNRSRDSLVDIATGYGLDGQGSIPNRGKIFLFFIVSRPALGPHPDSYPMGTRDFFTGDKVAGTLS